MAPAQMMKKGMSIWKDGRTSLEPESPGPELSIPSKPFSEMTDEELDAIDPKIYGYSWRELGWDVRIWGFTDPQH